MDTEEEGSLGVALERQIDLKSRRRFRRGELVWFRVSNMVPSKQNSEAPSRLPSITHWPGLVADIVANTSVMPSPNASLTVAWSIAGGVAPVSLQAQRQVTTSYEYHLRPLGMFSPANQIVRDAVDMLPWALGSELLAGAEGWDLIGHEGTRVIAEAVKLELAAGTAVLDEQAMHAAWMGGMGSRYPFHDMPDDWDTRVFRLSIALKTAEVSIPSRFCLREAIARAWTQTDKIEVMSDADINADDLKAIMDQQKTLYQVSSKFTCSD